MIMVDELRIWGYGPKCFKKGSCHLTTDGELEDLHLFAEKIGLKRKWFQSSSSVPHYDLTVSRRELALKNGAVFVSAKEQAKKRIHNRNHQTH